MVKIAITCREESSIWSNGLDQNIYFFLLMFREMGYNVDLVSEVKNAGKLLNEPIKHLNLKNILNYNLIIEVAHVMSENLSNFFNSKGRPIVSVKLGNNYFIDLENIIHNPKDLSRIGTITPYRCREIWISPHFERSKEYYETISRTEVKVCPYIWDPCILEMQEKKVKAIPDASSLKKIGIVEPNLNIIKNAISPLIICELLYNKNKSLVEEVYCFNSKKFENKNIFIEFVNSLNIHRDKISSYENRISMHSMFLNNLCGTIVSHQMYNELNYAYLEAIYYNRLLIHNSPMIKDAGYYYHEHDAYEGAEQLERGIKDFYNEKQIKENKKYLEIFSKNNKENKAKFKELIEGVV